MIFIIGYIIIVVVIGWSTCKHPHVNVPGPDLKDVTVRNPVTGLNETKFVYK